MNIIVLDTINLEPYQRDRLTSLGNLKIYKDIPQTAEEILLRLEHADIAIVGWSEIDTNIVQRLNHLKMISIWGTGYDFVDVKAANDRGIIVTNVPGYAFESVAEHVFAMLLSFSRKIPAAHVHVKSGNFNWEEFRGFELAGKTLGIIGMGSIGSRVSEIAVCFGLQVIAYTAHPEKHRGKEMNARFLPLDDVLAQSDIVTIHTPLTSDTEKLIGHREFSLMKKGAIIINTSRGKVIDESALLDALRSKKIAGACLDVLSDEPYIQNNPLLTCDNVLFTPHTAFHTTEALNRCIDICIDNVESFINKTPKNVILP